MPEPTPSITTIRTRRAAAVLDDYRHVLMLVHLAGECFTDPDRTWPPVLLRDIGRGFLALAQDGLADLDGRS